MMTEKQAGYIKSLLASREYQPTTIISAFNSGFELSSKDASDIIGYLLSCDKKEIDKYAQLKSKMYKVVDHKKSKKNEAIWLEVKKITNIYLNKVNLYNLTNEQYDAIAHLFQ